MSDLGKVIWLFGLSGAGKTTIAREIKKSWDSIIHLDGDIIRGGLNSDLGFSIEDRKENIRRVAEVARLFQENNIDVILSFITPTTKIRNMVIDIIPEVNYYFIDTPLQTCIDIDPKGLYQKYTDGDLKGMSGLDSPFDYPMVGIIKTVTTKNRTAEECAKWIITSVQK